MKMIDVWLLFNLLYPFLVVLIHTYMDTLRNEEVTGSNTKDTNDKVRIVTENPRPEIMNNVIKAGIVPVNETSGAISEIGVYQNVEQKMLMKKRQRLALMKKVSIVYIPCLCLVFAILYWVIGLKQAEII